MSPASTGISAACPDCKGWRATLLLGKLCTLLIEERTLAVLAGSERIKVNCEAALLLGAHRLCEPFGEHCKLATLERAWCSAASTNEALSVKSCPAPAGGQELLSDATSVPTARSCSLIRSHMLLPVLPAASRRSLIWSHMLLPVLPLLLMRSSLR